MSEIDEELLEDLYGWVDQIQFTRPKRDIRRDFSDGVLVAEAVQSYFPKYVEIHNYVGSTATKQKQTNWGVLNRKVFKKLGFEVTDEVINNIASCKPWAIEQFLMMLRRKLDRHLYETQRQPTDNANNSDRPEVDQNYKAASSAALPTQPRKYDSTHSSPTKYDSGHSIGGNTKAHGSQGSMQNLSNQNIYNQSNRSRDTVPKLQVEEKEQEILVKEETIQILQAKVRRLEHLLHLKDIRIDDLQTRLDRMESHLRPTAKYQSKK